MLSLDTSKQTKNTSSRNGMPIRMLVWHSTEGHIGSDLPILLGQTNRQVSSGYYVTRTGHVYQLAPDTRATWHAGVSSWLGHAGLWIQESSIGIEMENLSSPAKPTLESYPAVQYQAAVALGRMLQAKYGIERAYFVRHRDIAPGRKSDPENFDWPRFVNDVYSNTPPAATEGVSNGDMSEGARPLQTASDTAHIADQSSVSVAGAPPALSANSVSLSPLAAFRAALDRLILSFRQTTGD